MLTVKAQSVISSEIFSCCLVYFLFLSQLDKKKLFIGNLSYEVTQEQLNEQLAQYGTITDIYKPMGKGFAFVTFETDEQAQAAIDGMHEKELFGRTLTVQVARPREERPRFQRQGGYNNRPSYN
jgi:RNA recognition motif-containing protein